MKRRVALPSSRSQTRGIIDRVPELHTTRRDQPSTLPSRLLDIQHPSFTFHFAHVNYCFLLARVTITLHIILRGLLIYCTRLIGSFTFLPLSNTTHKAPSPSRILCGSTNLDL
jgi:hypothetical protein